MIRLKVITWTFLAVYAAMALATIVISLSGAFIFWDLSWLSDKTILVLSAMLRGELIIAAVIAIPVSLDPDVIASAEEYQKAKDALKYKRKML